MMRQRSGPVRGTSNSEDNSIASEKLPFEAYRGAGHYLFASYAHADSAMVYGELSALDEQGFKIWYDEGITPAHRWTDELAAAIDGCTVFVAFITPRFVASEYCINEIEYALRHGRPVLAVYLEPTELPRGLELSMGGRQAILREKYETEAFSRKLSAVLASMLRGEIDEPSSEARSEAPSRSSLLRELATRRIFRAAAMYTAIAWGGTEILAFLTEALWGEKVAAVVSRYLAILFIVGFPVAMVLSWTRDLGNRARRIFAASTVGILLAAMLLWALPNPTPPQHAPDDSPDTTLAGINPRSIAVLPFLNISDQQDDEYFSQGVSEEILNLLAKIQGLKVTSRTSSFHFAGQNVPLGTIANELGVRHILEGSIRRSGNRVRITAQLIDASDDSHVWSEIYDREILDIFAAQEAIASAIADKLRVTFEGPVRPGRPTDSEEAYDLYLRGWHFLRRSWREEDLRQARDYLLAALERDPGYSQAHALLAGIWVALGNLRYVQPATAFEQAREHAEAALAHDERLSDAHWAKGWIAISYQFDRLAATNAFRRSIELAPSNYMGHHGLSWALQMGGRYDEAAVEAKRAYDLDPLNIWTRSLLQELSYKRRDYEAAITHTKILLEIQPADPLNLGFLAELYARIGAADEALRLADEAVALAAGDPLSELSAAVAYSILDRQEQARDILHRTESLSTSRYVSPGSIAVTYASLGEIDRALDWLEQAISAYDSFVFNLDYPAWDPVRSDPRFVAMCDRLNMACAEVWSGKGE